jgi:hypothetical protein
MKRKERSIAWQDMDEIYDAPFDSVLEWEIEWRLANETHRHHIGGRPWE